MAGIPRGIVLVVILCAALGATLAKPQDQVDRPRGRQSGWYSSRSRDDGSSRSNARTAVDDPDEPSFGNRDDYGSRDPTYAAGRRRTGGRSRPAGTRRQGLGGRRYNPNQPPQPQPPPQPEAYNPNQPPQQPPQPEAYNPNQPPQQPPQPAAYYPNQPPQQPPQPAAYNPNQPPQQPAAYNPNPPPPPPPPPQPQPARPQTPPDTPRQPVIGFYDPRPQPVYDPRPQPVYDPRPQPVYNPRPAVSSDSIRQPVFGGYDPRTQPGYDPRPQPPPDTPRQPVFGGYDPRPQPPPDAPRQPIFGGYDPRPQPGYEPRPQPPPDTPRRPIFGGYDPKPVQYRHLTPGGFYQGPGNLGGSGPKDFVVGEEGVLCAPTCRGHCIIRDTECNCLQNTTCFEEYRHRLDLPPPPVDSLTRPDDCRDIECRDPCSYKVLWPDGWCMCDIDPTCAARPANNAYTKREADLDLLISQRDAHMAELRRASRHSQKTKRDADMEIEE